MATDTSLAAFAAILPSLNNLQLEVLGEVQRHGDYGCTPFEAIQNTGMLDYTLRPRITELRKRGLIVDSGQRRKNVRGRNEIVFVAA